MKKASNFYRRYAEIMAITRKPHIYLQQFLLKIWMILKKHSNCVRMVLKNMQIIMILFCIEPVSLYWSKIMKRHIKITRKLLKVIKIMLMFWWKMPNVWEKWEHMQTASAIWQQHCTPTMASTSNKSFQKESNYTCNLNLIT